MVFTTRIDSDTRARVHYLRNVKRYSTRKVAELCDVSRWSVVRISREKRHRECFKTSVNCKGRPKKLTGRQMRLLLRSVRALRHEEGNFSARRLMEQAGIHESEISVRSVTRFLNEHGYFYLQARKKGLVKKEDLKKRVKFAKFCRKNCKDNFWTHHVSFYLDGTGFAHKTNPLDQARAPTGRTWRKKSEGLTIGCTGKGRKEGTGGRVLKLMVAISYGKGVIACEPYEKMCGKYFSDFIDRNFDTMFKIADKGECRFWVQDGDPSQNSAEARAAMSRARCELFKIPPRSPDLNPIENLFNMTSQILKKDAIALNIRKESYNEFERRVIKTMKSIPMEYINKLISSMNKRLNLVIKNKGNRIKY